MAMRSLSMQWRWSSFLVSGRRATASCSTQRVHVNHTTGSSAKCSDNRARPQVVSISCKASNEANGTVAAAAAGMLAMFSAPLLIISNDDASCECGVSNEECHRDDVIRSCTLSWVTESTLTKAECSVHQSHDAVSRSDGSTGTLSFDPANAEYFDIKLVSSNEERAGLPQAAGYNQDACASVAGDMAQQHPLLHNKILILPNLLTVQECKMIVNDAERILDENKAKNIRGCKTESWTVYSRFDSDCREIMDRLLGRHVLMFIQQRLPEVAHKLFGSTVRCNIPQKDSTGKKYSAKETMGFYWDDPVIIKYDAGNKLAPHEDMRELTIVVPLNPLGDFPLIGGGTRFWREGTTPECADSSGGISVKPAAGTGIVFNGEITHSGNSVHAGTRFVLMTSITLDDDDEDNEVEDVCTDDDESGRRSEEEKSTARNTRKPLK